MSKKNIIVITVSLFIVLFAFLGYYFHNEIEQYIREERWLYAEPYIGKNIEIATQYEGGKKLFSVLDGNLNIYNNTLENVYNENLNTSNVIFKTHDKYTIVASTDKSFAKVFKNEKKTWEKDFDFDIKNVSVNKNGFSVLVFTKTGIKSGIKLFSDDGQELINLYLASTYAVDSEVSSNNRVLYVAEVDLNGINASSIVKIIDVETKNYKEIRFNNDEIITDIEFNKFNELLVQTDKSLYLIDKDNVASKLYNFEEKSVSFVTIEDLKYPLVIEKDNLILRAVRYDEDRFLNLPSEPHLYSIDGGKLAMLFENEIWIVDNNCNVIKKCKIENGLVNMRLFNNGKSLALIHNNKVELIGI